MNTNTIKNMEQAFYLGLSLLSLLFIGRVIKLWLSLLNFHKSIKSAEVIQLKLKKYYRYKYDKLIIGLISILAGIVSYKDSSNYYFTIFLAIIVIDSFTQFYCLPGNYVIFSDQGISMNHFQKYKNWKHLVHIIDEEDGGNLVLQFSKNDITIPLWGNENDLKLIVDQIDKYRPDIRQRI